MKIKWEGVHKNDWALILCTNLMYGSQRSVKPTVEEWIHLEFSNWTFNTYMDAMHNWMQRPN